MGQHEMHEELGPGLHVLREPSPLEVAGPMAVTLHADLCATQSQAEAMLQERSLLPRVDGPTLAEALVLAGRLGRAERIAARTRDRAVVEVGQRLASTGGGLAVHPTTIRERAAVVESSRAAVADAERALVDHAADIVTQVATAREDAAMAAEHAEQASLHREAEHMRRVRSMLDTRKARAIGVLLVATAIGVALYAIDVALWACPLPLLIGALWVLQDLRPRQGEAKDDLRARMEASSLLSQVAASTSELFSTRLAQTHLDEQATLYEAQRDRALEELRVAERSWRELAGDGVDIAELDDVLRRYDPQHEDARILARETVGVRTAEAVLRQLEDRWLEFWLAVDMDLPDTHEREDAVRQLGARISRGVVLVGPAAELAEDLAAVAPAAAIVVLMEAMDASDAAR